MTIALIGWAILCAISALGAKEPWPKFMQGMWALGFMVSATLVEILRS